MKRLSTGSLVLFSTLSMSSMAAARAISNCYPWEKHVGDSGQFTVDLNAKLCVALEKGETRDNEGHATLRSASVKTQASAVANIYNGTVEVATWDGSVTMPPDQGDIMVAGSLYAGGQQVWEASFPAVGELKKDIDLFSMEQKYPRTVMIGVIPANLIFGVRETGKIGLEAAIHREALTAAAKPNTQAHAYAEAGIGNDVVFIGVEGAVSLVDENLDMGAQLRKTVNGQGQLVMEGHVKGIQELHALDGKIDGFLRAGSERQTVPMYEFTGYKESSTIFDRIFNRVVD